MGVTDSVFLYVNSSFAPALDEVVGNLHRVSVPALRAEKEEEAHEQGSVLRIPVISLLLVIR